MNGREAKIKGVGKVDGFCKENNTVYEFQGCFWHGCEKCFNRSTINTNNQIDMETLRKRTKEKNKKIMDAEFNLVETWECNFAEIEKENEFINFKKENKIEIVGPLNPRNAFFGGRTNITKLTYDFKKDEKGKYVDFVSLYPTVQFFKNYPKGHPTKIFAPEKYDENWFGFIKCSILPPRKLYHPVLPVKTKFGNAEKLLFPLCRVCAEKKQKKCEHTDEERMCIGTWCTPEIKVALEKGYVHKENL